jgi:hypothetical protein
VHHVDDVPTDTWTKEWLDELEELTNNVVDAMQRSLGIAPRARSQSTAAEQISRS